MIFERFFLPIVLQQNIKYQEAKSSEGDSPRMSEKAISLLIFLP
jgi:hypothetical protein